MITLPTHDCREQRTKTATRAISCNNSLRQKRCYCCCSCCCCHRQALTHRIPVRGKLSCCAIIIAAQQRPQRWRGPSAIRDASSAFDTQDTCLRRPQNCRGKQTLTHATVYTINPPRPPLGTPGPPQHMTLRTLLHEQLSRVEK